jgi:hypothetical protein
MLNMMFVMEDIIITAQWIGNEFEAEHGAEYENDERRGEPKLVKPCHWRIYLVNPYANVATTLELSELQFSACMALALSFGECGKDDPGRRHVSDFGHSSALDALYAIATPVFDGVHKDLRFIP